MFYCCIHVLCNAFDSLKSPVDGKTLIIPIWFKNQVKAHAYCIMSGSYIVFQLFPDLLHHDLLKFTQSRDPIFYSDEGTTRCGVAIFGD